MAQDILEVGDTFTPWPLGEIPGWVQYWPGDTPPNRRLSLVVAEAGPGWMRDKTSGYVFGWRAAPCGFGCYCAAEAWLVPDEVATTPTEHMGQVEPEVVTR